MCNISSHIIHVMMDNGSYCIFILFILCLIFLSLLTLCLFHLSCLYYSDMTRDQAVEVLKKCLLEVSGPSMLHVHRRLSATRLLYCHWWCIAVTAFLRAAADDMSLIKQISHVSAIRTLWLMLASRTNFKGGARGYVYIYPRIYFAKYIRLSVSHM